MKISKIMLVLLLLWLVPAALSPVFDYAIWFPFSQTTISNDFIDLRLHSVRSATFMTLAYFVINHLRGKRPVSSLSPIFVFLNFLIFFSVILIAKNGGARTEWLIVMGGILGSVILFTESKKESNKIFKDAW